MLLTVFEPMLRGEAGRGTARSVGLGLFIVNEIAKAHVGEMEVRSSRDDGTLFMLRFPAGLSREDEGVNDHRQV
jgi:phosphoserine phosphatase RsbU/P